MKKACYICDSFELVNVFKNIPSMSSDGQIVDFIIEKEECTYCGTVRSADVSFLNNFYENHYKLNIANNDPTFVYNGECMPKSKMHFEWIEKLIGDKMSNIKSVIEIGCGSGNLLNLFNVDEKYGVEPSKAAWAHSSKIASVKNSGYEDISEDKKYDLVLSSCVIEHTIDPNDFLKKKWNIVNDNGLVVIGLPIQDKDSFDVFFLDHLHHFTSKQFVHLCQKNGFSVEKFEIGYKCMVTIAYFVLRKVKTILLDLAYEKNENFYKSQVWIDNLNNFLEAHVNKNILAFGYGETSFFFQTYCKLNSFVKYFIDDIRSGETDYICSVSEAISRNLLTDGYVILLTNPHYHKFLISKFDRQTNVKFYSPFSNQLS